MKTIKRRPLATSAGAQIKAARPVSVPDLSVQLKQVREVIHFTQAELAPLLRVSHRTLADLEGKKKTIGQREQKAFIELKRLVSSLSEIMPANEVGKWLKTPNEAFGGFKPLELLDRGEVDRIYEMIYVLKAGIPG